MIGSDAPSKTGTTDAAGGARPAQTRKARISQLTQGFFDLLVVGGGVHGVCVAKLAAAAGLRTALLEMNDYASGTSSRSTKLIHGGLRYLEMFDFQQTFEGIKAREELLERWSAQVAPCSFLIPVPCGAFFTRCKFAVGLWLYDLFVRRPQRRHRWIPRRKLAYHNVSAADRALMGCFSYTDALMNDARMVIDLMVAAEQQGACCLNHAEVESITECASPQQAPHDEPDAGVVVRWRDCSASSGGGRYETRARVVVNCAGPWAPHLAQPADCATRPQVRYSRGSHLLFSVPWHDPALFLPLAEKGRYYFVVPHPTGTMVGTTEREVQTLEIDPQPSADEVEEILSRVRRDLPAAGLNRSTLHYAFAGVRTLPLRMSSQRAPRQGVSKLSRKHIWSVNGRVVTLVGGKYTTFAWTAREGVLKAANVLGAALREPLDALADIPSQLSKLEQRELLTELHRRCGVSGAAVERAVARLGRQLLAYCDQPEAWTEVGAGVLRVELLHAVRCEQAETVEDVVRRRIDLECAPGNGLSVLEAVTEVLAQGRDAADLQRQVTQYRSRISQLQQLLQEEEPPDAR